MTGLNTEIDLNFQAHIVHARIHDDSGASVLRILGDLLGHDTVGEEGEAVRLHFESCAVLHQRYQACPVGLALA